MRGGEDYRRMRASRWPRLVVRAVARPRSGTRSTSALSLGPAHGRMGEWDNRFLDREATRRGKHPTHQMEASSSMASAEQAGRAGSAQIGVTGMGVMGRNLARNFARHGYAVALHNRTASKAADVARDFGHEGTFVA